MPTSRRDRSCSAHGSTWPDRPLLGVLLTTAALARGSPSAAPAWLPAPRTDDGPLRKEPYLIFPGDSTRMQVLWQLTATATSTIEWGPDTTYTAAAPRPASTAVITAHLDHHWPDPRTALLLPGDSHRSEPQGIVQRRSAGLSHAGEVSGLRATRERTGHPRPGGGPDDLLLGCRPEFQTLALVVGTWSQRRQRDRLDRSVLQPPTRISGASRPRPAFQSCIGNHEGSGRLLSSTFPYPSPAGATGPSTTPAHLCCRPVHELCPGFSPLQWIANDLAGSNKPWKFMASTHRLVGGGGTATTTPTCRTTFSRSACNTGFDRLRRPSITTTPGLRQRRAPRSPRAGRRTALSRI